MGVKQQQLSATAFEDFSWQVLSGAAFCADQQILALADELHDIIRSRRYARWEASPESRSFQPALGAGLIGADR